MIFDVNEAVPQYPWYIIMAMPDTLKHKRSAAVKVLKAHKRAVEYLNSAPDAGNDIIADTFKLGTVTDADGNTHTAEEVVAAARQRLGWEWDIKDQDMAFIQRLMDYSRSLGYIKNPLKAEDIVDLSLVKEVR